MFELIYSLGFGGMNEAPPISILLASSNLIAASHKLIEIPNAVRGCPRSGKIFLPLSHNAISSMSCRLQLDARR
jgi:hypothetical protein